MTASNPIQEQALAAGLDLERVPQHVAVIMDGNGRWAERQGLPRLLGHRQGYLTLRRVLRDADQLGVKVLTVYGFSAENWRRPAEEVEGLMLLIDEAARNELSHLVDENVRTRIAGRRQELPEFLQRSLEDLEHNTARATGITFVLAINYGGRAEIVDAANALAARGEPITEEAISRNLYCADLPEPDLMVRTAGEMRWSNFLLWQSAYAELFVTDKTWPEFDAAELIRAVGQYQKRVRKFGGLIG